MFRCAPEQFGLAHADAMSKGKFADVSSAHGMAAMKATTGLALEELEDLGLTNAPPPDFWRHLIFAAESMELWERAADFKRKIENA